MNNRFANISVFKRTTLLLVVPVLLSWTITGQNTLYAQQWEEITFEQYSKILQEAFDFMNKESYKVNTVYTSFRGHESNTPYEQQVTATIKGSEDHAYMKQGNTIIIFDGELKATVVNEEKYISVSNSSIKEEIAFRNEISKIPDELITSIKIKTGRQHSFIRIKFKEPVEISRCDIKLDKNRQFEKATYFMREWHQLDPDNPQSEKKRVKVEIEFSDFKSPVQVSNDKKMNHILTIEDDNKIKLSHAYSAYQLFDYRIRQ